MLGLIMAATVGCTPPNVSVGWNAKTHTDFCAPPHRLPANDAINYNSVKAQMDEARADAGTQMVLCVWRVVPAMLNGGWRSREAIKQTTRPGCGKHLYMTGIEPRAQAWGETDIITDEAIDKLVSEGQN